MGELMELTPNEKQLIEMGRQLDPTKRHYITIEYRGNQPWKFKEKVSETALSLKPETKKVEWNRRE